MSCTGTSYLCCDTNGCNCQELECCQETGCYSPYCDPYFYIYYNTPTCTSGGGGLSKGAIAGIVIGIIFGLIILVCCICRCRKQRTVSTPVIVGVVEMT